MTPDESKMQNKKIALMIFFSLFFFYFAFLVLNDLDKIVNNTNNYEQVKAVDSK